MTELWQLWRLQPLIVQLSGLIVGMAIVSCLAGVFMGLFMRVGESDARRYERFRREQDERDTWRIVEHYSQPQQPKIPTWQDIPTVLVKRHIEWPTRES